jgi:hypothetical protein
MRNLINERLIAEGCCRSSCRAIVCQPVEFGRQPIIDIVAALGFGEGRAAEQIDTA